MIDLLDFGAQPNNPNFDNAPAINAAIASAGNGPIEIKAPAGVLTLGGEVAIVPGPLQNFAMYGAGLWNTVFRRLPSYPTGNLFRFEGGQGGTASVFENVRIENAAGFENNAGAAIKILNIANVHLLGVEVFDGWRGFDIEGASGIRMDRVRYLQTAEYSESWQSDAGLIIAGHTYDCVVGASSFGGQNAGAAKNVTAGIRVTGADGAQFHSISAAGKRGIDIIGGADSIDDLYFSIPVIDGCGITGVRLSGSVAAGKVFTNIRFVGAHINPGGFAGGQDAVQIAGNCDEVQFHSGNVNLAWGAGFLLLGGSNYRGQPKRLISIEGVDISENNLSNTPNIHGIAVSGGAAGVNLRGNVIGNRSVSGHQKYGIALGNGLSRCVISDNRLFGNEIGGLYLGAGHADCSMIDNIGA